MENSRQISRRSFLRASSIGAVGLALAACTPAQVSPSDSEGAAPTGEQVTIRFHARIGSQEDALYEQQMPAFMEANPNIEIVKESFPGEEFSSKIATMQAGNTLGDVVWSALGSAKIYFAYAQNIIQPIDDLVDSQDVDLTEYYLGCIDAITVDGNLLGLPFKAHPGVALVYYNQSAFDEAGIAYPTESWTIEEQLAMAEALTVTEGDRTSQFGYLPNTSWKGFVTLFRAFNTQLISEDGTQFQMNSPEGTEAVQWLYNFFHTSNVAPKPEEMLGFGDQPDRQMWTGGQLAMFQAGTWASNLGNLIEDKFAWDVVPNAIGPGGVGGSDYEVDAYAITTATEHPVEAFEWVRFLCNQESGVLLGVIGGTVGGRPDVYGSPVLLETPYRQTFKEVMDNAMDSRVTNNWRQEEAETALVQLTQPLWAGDESPTPAFIDSVASQIQDIMDKPRP